jgi:PST family polysaccharide transporter
VTVFRKIAALCRGNLAQNAIALYGVTIANAILPLVTVPYLARVLGSGAWGMVLFAQTVAVWPAMLVEFGFVYSATREVARHAGDPAKLREIVGEVMACKAGLSFLGAATGIAFWLGVPEFRQNPLILLGALWLALAQGFSPLWYFQGIQRLSLPAIIEVVCRLLFTISVFFLIRSPEDATRVILYQALSITVSLGITLFLMYRTVSFTVCGFARAVRALREAWHFFLFVAIINLYAKANSFMLGLLIAPAVVSFYGGPERLMRGFLAFTGPINQVLYPHLAHLVKHDMSAARKTIRRGTLWLGALGILLGLALTLGAPWLVSVLFGAGYDRAIPVLRVLGLVCPFSALNGVLGIRWMFPLGHERTYNRIVMAGAALDVALVLALTPWLKELGAAFALLVTEMAITVTVFATLWKMRLNPFQVLATEKSPAT